MKRLRIGTLCGFAILLASVIPVRAARRSHESPLICAVRRHEFGKVKALLASGVDLNERDEYDEQTALMWSAAIGDARIAQTLLAAGADTGLKDDEGQTALSLAESNGHPDIAALIRQTIARQARHKSSRIAKAR